jgi:hypothetical protein
LAINTTSGTASNIKNPAQPRSEPNVGIDGTADDEDQAQLEALGFQSDFKRDMSPWANFSLGFTYLSPVVGIYTVFAFALSAAGPPMIWSLLIAGVGQLLVALVFSEVVAQFPVAVASIPGRAGCGDANGHG